MSGPYETRHGVVISIGVGATALAALIGINIGTTFGQMSGDRTEAPAPQPVEPLGVLAGFDQDPLPRPVQP